MSVFDPAAIVEVLNEHGVRYVVIGGYAATVHGAARPTLDIDVTPEQSAGNLDRLAAAMRELGAKIRTDAVDGGLPFAVTGEDLATRSMLNVVTTYGELDVSMVPNGTTGYDDLIRDAEPRTLRAGVVVDVASLADVIRSKEAAGRPKDLVALPELYRLLQAGTSPTPTDEIAAPSQAPTADRQAAETPGKTPQERAARYLRERDR